MPQSFTTTYNGIILVPFTPVKISEAFNPKLGGTPPLAIDFQAIWDTGATHSVITENVVKKLNLGPIGKRISQTGNGPINADIYFVNIILPMNAHIIGVTVACLPILGTDALIGMDIICKGDFAISNKSGQTKLSYQIPSTHDIDFVKNPTGYSQHIPKVERNDPCPCGSGKKYKKCHGS